MKYKRNILEKKAFEKLIDKLRDIKISKRILCSYLIISILPVILLFIYVNYTATNLIINNTVSSDKIASNLIKESISSYIDKFDSITNEIIWDSTLLNDIKNYTSLTKNQKKNFNEKLFKILKSRTSYISDIADFTILDENFNVVYNEGFRYISYSTKLDKVKKGIKDSKAINWTSINQGKSNYIVMTKPIKIQDSVYGYLFLALKDKVILDMFKDYNKNFNGFGIIADEFNTIICTNSDYIKSNLNNIKSSKLKEFYFVKNIDKNVDIVKYNNKKFILSTQKISYTSWTLYGLIPYSYIYISCMNLYKTHIIISLFVIAISIIISILIYKSIVNPLNEIVQAMNEMNENNIGDEIHISGNDEISFIMKQYNKMSRNIKNLLNTVKVRENEKRDVTFKMLQAQINPHFLFNTLGSLRYIALLNDDNSVANGLESLAKLLRNIILNKNDFITIEQEIENIKNYITIQKIRYGDNFDINFDVDKKLYSQKILKFILQPIVENSILHGFEELNEESYIKITLREKDNMIAFEIEDNGLGITDDKLENGNFDIDRFAGIGVKNIKDRLNLYYEGVFLFEIKSAKYKGTKVKIVIPKN